MNTNPLKYKSYISYLRVYGKQTPFISKLYDIFKFLRKYILVGRIFRYAKIIFLWLETGTFFLLYATIIVILLPLFILILLGLFLFTLNVHRKANRFFLKKIQTTEFDIIFLDDEKNIKPCDYNSYNCIKLYVIKSPFTQLHSAVKQYDNNSYIISLFYFYSLKRKVLDKHSKNVNYPS